jgi:hypothetical protein
MAVSHEAMIKNTSRVCKFGIMRRVSTLQPMSFDVFSSDEADLVQKIIKERADDAWAKPIIAAINRNGGLIGTNKDQFLELRFGHVLRKAGISPNYEIAGEGDSTLDFGFESAGKGWSVELMRLSETKAAKEATKAGVDKDGIPFTRRILSTDAEDKKQSIEGETLKAIERICGKCELDDKPHKFPPPADRYHVILVDMRTYLHGGDLADRVHIALGTNYVTKASLRVYWQGRPITGFFHEATNLKGAANLRDRVHFVGFVNERSYGEDAIGGAMQFFANPKLFVGETPEQKAALARAAFATWPLKGTRLMNAGSEEVDKEDAQKTSSVGAELGGGPSKGAPGGGSA